MKRIFRVVQQTRKQNRIVHTNVISLCYFYSFPYIAFHFPGSHTHRLLVWCNLDDNDDLSVSSPVLILTEGRQGNQPIQRNSIGFGAEANKHTKHYLDTPLNKHEMMYISFGFWANGLGIVCNYGCGKTPNIRMNGKINERNVEDETLHASMFTFQLKRFNGPEFLFFFHQMGNRRSS